MYVMYVCNTCLYACVYACWYVCNVCLYVFVYEMHACMYVRNALMNVFLHLGMYLNMKCMRGGYVFMYVY